jgi:aspartyl/glutamyl-tRNA(Asn/Gln) amidotransferase C subunit
MDKKTVLQVAKLAHLECSEDEISYYQTELSKIVESFHDITNFQVDTVDIADADNIDLIVAKKSTEKFWEKPENPENSLAIEDLLAAAPDKEGVFIRVPNVLDRTT